MQDDLPQVASLDLPLDLPLVLAGAHGASVPTAAARVAPVAGPRSDRFVRRLIDVPGDAAGCAGLTPTGG